MSKAEKDLEKQVDLKAKRQRQRAKQEALDILRDDPNNLSAIKTMAKISRKEGNTREEQRYLYRRLEVEPDKPKILVQLIRIAKNSNDIEEIRRLRRQLKSMKTSKASEIKAAISISSADKDIVSCKILHNQLVELTKRNFGMSLQEAAEETKTIQPRQVRTIEQEMMEKANKQEPENPIQKARRIIHESEDISQDVETIKALLEGQDQTEVALVLAELYFHTGMRERAEKSLKAYKKNLDLVADRSDIRLVNQAMELTRSTKTLPYKWEEIWRTIEERKKTFPSAPGGEDEGR